MFFTILHVFTARSAKKDLKKIDRKKSKKKCHFSVFLSCTVYFLTIFLTVKKIIQNNFFKKFRFFQKKNRDVFQKKGLWICYSRGFGTFLSLLLPFFFSLFGGERRKVYLSSSRADTPEEEERKLLHLSVFTQILWVKTSKSFALWPRMTKAYAFVILAFFPLQKRLKRFSFLTFLWLQKGHFRSTQKWRLCLSLFDRLSIPHTNSMRPFSPMASKMPPFFAKKSIKGQHLDAKSPSGPWRPIVARRLLSQFCDPNGQKMSSFSRKMRPIFQSDGSKISQKSRLAQFPSPDGDPKKRSPRGILPPIFETKMTSKMTSKWGHFRVKISKIEEIPRRASWFWESPCPDFKRNTISYGVSEKSSLKFLKIRNFRTRFLKNHQNTQFWPKNRSPDWFL